MPIKSQLKRRFNANRLFFVYCVSNIGFDGVGDGFGIVTHHAVVERGAWCCFGGITAASVGIRGGLPEGDLCALRREGTTEAVASKKAASFGEVAF